MHIEEQVYDGELIQILYPEEGYVLQQKETGAYYGSVSLKDGRKQEDYIEVETSAVKNTANVESLSITPSTSDQAFTASGDLNGYTPVSVNAVTASIDNNIQAENIVNGVSILGVNGSATVLNGDTLNITPTTSIQTLTPTSPKNGFTQVNVSAVTSSIDSNISANNIKKDVTILGVTGTYEASSNNLYNLNYMIYNNNGTYEYRMINGLDINATTWNIPKEIYKDDTNVIGLNFGNLESISGSDTRAFRNCTNLKFVNFPKLKTINGGMFWSFLNCTSLISINFPSLETFSNYDNSSFEQCTSLVYVDFPSLTSGYLRGMFYKCTNLEYVSFPALNLLTGNGLSLDTLFSSCTSLKEVFFPSLNINSFSATSDTRWMLSGTGTDCIHTLHFPSNLETKLSTMQGYPLFSGTSGYVVLAFDLPATS